MPNPAPDASKSPEPSQPPQPHRSVLASLADRTGLAPKVLLPDTDSEHGASPMVDPGATSARLVPQGRGNYQMLGEIARGGMGVILKGHDTDLGRDVAVKVLDGTLAKNPAVVQRFVEEAQIGGQLQHPGIVPVYELGLMADDVPYFTMKLVKGRTLSAHFQQRKSPADDRGRLLAIFESVCQTVAYAHSKGVLHRDLKPANVMVGAFGEVQVVDWGLAKVLRRGGIADEKRAKETKSLRSVIATVRSGPGSSGSDSLVGSVMGTPAYMAPEQAQGEVELLDERADVFSLGAILCELLTGRPPYEEIEGEAIVAQAARAKLEPARARIEACEADPALIRLCLDCLTPSRAARPANAEAVAKAVHAYLTSTEERAQKAELAAVEARIKAAEERRARRLTVALAGTIALALVLTGAGFWWAAQERAKRAVEGAKRAELLRAEVDAAQGESIELGRAGRPEEALAAARRALTRAQTGESDVALLDRAQKFVANAERDVHAAESERSLVEQDETLRSRLIDLRLKHVTTQGDRQREVELDAAFTQAFHEYGVDLEGADLVPALRRIRERAIAEDVALALDDWGRLRRAVHGAKSEKAENLYLLAMDLDPDPERTRMREAIAANDRATMLELASAENLVGLGAGSITVLCAALWNDSKESHREVFRILEPALRLYPGDFALQALAGNFYREEFRFDFALACRAAASSLRPRDLAARVKLAESLYFMGHLTEAQALLHACLAVDPTHVEANDLLGLVQMLFGDYAGALTTLSSTPAIATDPNTLMDLQVARFFAGFLSRQELEHLAETEFNPIAAAGYFYSLVDHPDPELRNPEFVLRVLPDRVRLFPQSRWPATVEIVARVRLEDWAGALEVFENQFKPQYLMLLTPMSYEFLRCLIYGRLGREVEARQAYDRGMLAWEEATRDHPEMWERSDAMRWRREAEVALAK